MPATTSDAATRPAVPQNYLDVLLALHPDFPSTQPLPTPLELREAARFVFDVPVYLDPLGQLWITMSAGDPIRNTIRRASQESTHVARERVRFVHRQLDPAGLWQVHVVIDKSDGGGFELVTRDGRRSIGERADYVWRRAFSWNENFVVPTTSGVSIFRPEQLPMELHHELLPHDDAPATNVAATRPATAPPDGRGEPQMLLDYRGLLVWIPPGEHSQGSVGVGRFVDGSWSTFGPENGWPAKILSVVPLVDGGVLVLYPGEDGSTALALNQLDPTAEPDPKPIEALVAQLSDADPDRRDEAHKQLSLFGQRSWPILERLLPDQPPEAAERIRQLLDAKLAPKLGRMTLLPGKTSVYSRLRDGGAILFAEGGVSIPRAGRPDVEPTIVAPAWICIRPGRPIEPLSQWLLVDLRPDARIEAWGDEWIVTDSVKGPQRLLGNHLDPILNKKNRKFNQLVGIDRYGRWLFRERLDDDRTLIVDPTFPDPAPLLPVWQNPAANAESVGWTEAGWPVMKRGGAFVLDANGWRALDPKTEKFVTDLPASPSTEPTTSPATTTASTAPSTRDSAEAPLLVDSDGNRYYDGTDSLRVITKSGREVTWPLPPLATGHGDVWLLKVDDRLFLFNQPGRVLRIRTNPNDAEPFKLEATFVRGIPGAEQCTRVWKDPAGRIVLAYAGNQLAVLFPSGRIPPEMQKLMPASELQKNDEEDREK